MRKEICICQDPVVEDTAEEVTAASAAVAALVAEVTEADSEVPEGDSAVPEDRALEAVFTRFLLRALAEAVAPDLSE